MNRWLISSALASSLLAAGCGADVGSSAPTESQQESLTTTSFSTSYAGESLGICNSFTRESIFGYEPTTSGTYPVFVYVTGTTMPFKGPEAMALIQDMAARGFVAATVEYDNLLYPLECGLMQARARCIYNKNSFDSAISRICGRSKAACSTKGIVVSGFSQGANIGSLAKNYDSRVRAAYLIGHGGIGALNLPLQGCLQASANDFANNQMRVINGENDGFFGGDPDGVRNQLQIATGVSCPGSWNCLQPDGSGWAMVRASELADGTADHCYYYVNGGLTCAPAPIDPAWSGSAAWARPADLNWLASKAGP